jgi:hypothetical protein
VGRYLNYPPPPASAHSATDIIYDILKPEIHNLNVVLECGYEMISERTIVSFCHICSLFSEIRSKMHFGL